MKLFTTVIYDFS